MSKPTPNKSQNISKKKKPRRTRFKKTSRSPEILEHGTIAGLRQNKKFTDELLRFHWDYYWELAFQRNKILDKLVAALEGSCQSSFKITNWQRLIRYKYTLNPLSCVGSVKDVGGRFNTGEDIHPDIQSFPALYLACDKDTAMQETGPTPVEGSELNAFDLALARPDSISIVSVGGLLDTVIDLRTSHSLQKLVDCIKGFTVPKELLQKANKLGIKAPELLTDAETLQHALLRTNWIGSPRHYDVPDTTQVFGQLVHQAGITGILYPSSKNGKDCLAVYPRNFRDSDSYIQLNDHPEDIDMLLRIDSKTFTKCEIY